MNESQGRVQDLKKRDNISLKQFPNVDPENEGNIEEGRTERSRERRPSPYGIM